MDFTWYFEIGRVQWWIDEKTSYCLQNWFKPPSSPSCPRLTPKTWSPGDISFALTCIVHVEAIWSKFLALCWFCWSVLALHELTEASEKCIWLGLDTNYARIAAILTDHVFPEYAQWTPVLLFLCHCNFIWSHSCDSIWMSIETVPAISRIVSKLSSRRSRF